MKTDTTLLSMQAGEANAQAVKSLARSAVLEERIATAQRYGSSDHNAVIVWTYCRALCAEFGIDFEQIKREARAFVTTI